MYPCICTYDRVCLAVHPCPPTHTHKHGYISNGNFSHNLSRYISPRPQNPRHEPGCKVFMIGCEHFLSIYPRSPLVPPNSPGRELVLLLQQLPSQYIWTHVPQAMELQGCTRWKSCTKACVRFQGACTVSAQVCRLLLSSESRMKVISCVSSTSEYASPSK